MSVMQALGCGAPDWPKMVSKIQTERKDLAKKGRLLTDEVATAAGRLVASKCSNGSSFRYHRQVLLGYICHTMCTFSTCTERDLFCCEGACVSAKLYYRRDFSSGFPIRCRDDADASFLGLVATAALKANSTALILLTGGAPPPAGKPAKAATGFFVVAGPPGKPNKTDHNYKIHALIHGQPC